MQDGWLWTPQGYIPPREYFPPPLTREEFKKVQNAQLEV
jgi:hypothetical protein